MKQKTKKKFIFITAIILMIVAIGAYVLSMDEETNPVLEKMETENLEIPEN